MCVFSSLCVISYTGSFERMPLTDTRENKWKCQILLVATIRNEMYVWVDTPTQHTTHTHIHTDTHTHTTCTHTHTDMHKNAHTTYKHTHTDTYIHTHNTDTPTPTSTRTHTHMHTHTDHRVIIMNPKNSNKMADAIDPEKQIAFIMQRNNTWSFLWYILILSTFFWSLNKQLIEYHVSRGSEHVIKILYFWVKIASCRSVDGLR